MSTPLCAKVGLGVPCLFDLGDYWLAEALHMYGGRSGRACAADVATRPGTTSLRLKDLQQFLRQFFAIQSANLRQPTSELVHEEIGRWWILLLPLSAWLVHEIHVPGRLGFEADRGLEELAEFL